MTSTCAIPTKDDEKKICLYEKFNEIKINYSKLATIKKVDVVIRRKAEILGTAEIELYSPEKIYLREKINLEKEIKMTNSINNAKISIAFYNSVKKSLYPPFKQSEGLVTHNTITLSANEYPDTIFCIKQYILSSNVYDPSLADIIKNYTIKKEIPKEINVEILNSSKTLSHFLDLSFSNENIIIKTRDIKDKGDIYVPYESLDLIEYSLNILHLRSHIIDFTCFSKDINQIIPFFLEFKNPKFLVNIPFLMLTEVNIQYKTRQVQRKKTKVYFLLY